jgi:hypothetical protein
MPQIEGMKKMSVKSNGCLLALLFSLLALVFGGCEFSAREKAVIIQTTVEGADFYVDGLMVRKQGAMKILVKMESGEHLIEIKKRINKEWDLYGKKKATIVDGNVVIGINVKRVPTFHRQNRLEKKKTEQSSRFVREGDSVLDKETGFLWQDDPENEKYTYSYAQARNYCANLTASSREDWTLPSVSEFYTIADIDQYTPALVHVFKYFYKGHYWTKDKSAKREGQQWYVDFNFGDSDYRKDSKKSAVRCVSKAGNTLPRSLFVRDDKNEIVENETHNLVWQDNKDVTIVKFDHKKATQYCANLNLAGYDDWRLPEILEMLKIVDHKAHNPAINAAFKNSEPTFYWSNTDFPKSVADAWYVDFGTGYSYSEVMSNEYLIRCVRDKK